LIAHKFANEIIFRLGGGVNGITESKLYYISNRSGRKEVWAMDYDGADQNQITHLGSAGFPVAAHFRLTPAAFAFSSYPKGSGLEIMMYSNELGRMVNFPRFGGTNATPAWAPDGTKLAFASSMRGAMEIYVADASGAGPKR